MKRLLFLIIFFSMMCIAPSIGHAQKPHYGYPHGYWRGSYYRPHYRPYYYPWYGSYYRLLPRHYYAPAPAYVYPPHPVIYAPPPAVIIVPNQAYAYPDIPPPPPAPSSRVTSPLQSVPTAILQPIYFDLNKSAIRPDAEKILKQNLEWFRQNPGRKVSIQGNCDPRATELYNLSLGKRRAEAARQYLVELGVDAKLLDVVSFGKEMSTCKGKDESCWAKERRVDFIPSP